MNKCNACGNEQEAVGVCTKCGAPVEAAVSEDTTEESAVASDEKSEVVSE